MNRAILFWFYKEPKLCQNRLELLRQYNPETLIFGLYGGDPALKDQFKMVTARYLDDYYSFDIEKDQNWKWRHGDLLITQWYRERGKGLKWDSIVIVQWDMLVLAPIKKLFEMVTEDQILLSGYEPIGKNDSFSPWISPPARMEAYQKFLFHIEEKYQYQQQPYRCLFVVVVFPRLFLDKYAVIDYPELGFIEYRVPIYAQIFQTPVCISHAFKVSWQEKNPLRRIISPRKQQIPLSIILYHLLNQNGSRIFHPYHDIFPLCRTRLSDFFTSVLKDIPVLMYEVSIRIKRRLKRSLYLPTGSYNRKS